jgi:NTP pyrophosphatase (non-canonical NTP hydrolase)
MTLDEYQAIAVSTAIYPRDTCEAAFSYCALGLTGEAGEVAEKIKKFLRDGVINDEEVAKEIGDVLWYCANLADELGFTLQEVAVMNANKLYNRKMRGVLQGNGDNR